MSGCYTLASDGDDIEKRSNNLFLSSEFPSYEKFWQANIVQLTGRPSTIHFLDDGQLAAIGKNDEDICIAQLHYTILRHLFRAYSLKQVNPLDIDQFVEGIARLSAALDVADELLERCRNRGTYNPWQESEGSRARRSWRRTNNSMQWLRDYRNRILHGRITPAVLVIGSYPRYRVPKFGQETNYLDWRKVTSSSVGSGGRVRNDFDAPNNLLHDAWSKTLEYLETNWAAMV